MARKRPIDAIIEGRVEVRGDVSRDEKHKLPDTEASIIGD